MGRRASHLWPCSAWRNSLGHWAFIVQLADSKLLIYTMYHWWSAELCYFSVFSSSVARWGRALKVVVPCYPTCCDVCMPLHGMVIVLIDVLWYGHSLARVLISGFGCFVPLVLSLQVCFEVAVIKRAWRSLHSLPRPRLQKERAAHTRRSKNCDSFSHSSCIYLYIHFVHLSVSTCFKCRAVTVVCRAASRSV